MVPLIRRAPLLLAVVVALAATASARADCVTPSGSVTSTPLTPDGSLRAFSGTISPFGAVQGILDIQPNPNGSFTGVFVMTTPNGLVYGTIAGQFTSPFTYAETITFTGGTGRYRHISGEADVLGAFNPDGTATDTVVGGSVCF
jgi:hypothetical protein